MLFYATLMYTAFSRLTPSSKEVALPSLSLTSIKSMICRRRLVALVSDSLDIHKSIRSTLNLIDAELRPGDPGSIAVGFSVASSSRRASLSSFSSLWQQEAMFWSWTALHPPAMAQILL